MNADLQVNSTAEGEAGIVELLGSVGHLRTLALRNYRNALGNLVELDMKPGEAVAPEEREAAVRAARDAEKFARSADEAFKALISSDTHLRSAALSLILNDRQDQAQMDSDLAAAQLHEAGHQVDQMLKSAPAQEHFESLVMNRLSAATSGIVGSVDAGLGKFERAVQQGGHRLTDELGALASRLRGLAAIVKEFPARVLAYAKETGQRVAQVARDQFDHVMGRAEALRAGAVESIVNGVKQVGHAGMELHQRTHSAVGSFSDHVTATARTVDGLIQSVKGKYQDQLVAVRAERAAPSTPATIVEPTLEVESTETPRFLMPRGG